jgi:hypothetical protein
MRFRTACAIVALQWTMALCAQTLSVQNSVGVKLAVDDKHNQPVLRVVVSGEADDAIEVLFPEHVTVKQRNGGDAEQLYLFRPGKQEDRPKWRRAGQSLEYERELKGGIYMKARATLEEDGVIFHYEFVNLSNVDYVMITAVTDPRLTSVFHDVRLERTYVHHQDGFDLLASETPGRLTMPLDQWLPSRYLASYTWPVPAQRIEHRGDAITYYNKSRAVDEPLIATLSTDRKWVVASFTNTTGNVWSNPELTCQHVDPERSLAAGKLAVFEVKMLVLRGSLDDVLQKVRLQRSSLK